MTLPDHLTVEEKKEIEQLLSPPADGKFGGAGDDPYFVKEEAEK